MSKKNKHKDTPHETPETAPAEGQKKGKEMLEKIVQKGKNVGKKVKSKVKAKVQDVAQNKVIAENLKKLTPSDESQKQKLKGLFLILVGAVFLLFVGIFLVNKILRAQSIAELIPAQSAIGFFEVNIDSQSTQARQFSQLFSSYPEFQRDGILNIINLALPVNYETELEPWLGRKAGVALIQSQPGELTPVIFIESRDRQKALSFFKSRVLKNSNDELIQESYNDFDFYTYRLSQPYSFFFLNQYVVLAGNRQTLKQLSDAHRQNQLLLVNEENYRRVANNLPQGGLGFGYVNDGNFFDALAKNPAYTTRKARELLILQPFLRLFAAQGISLNAGEKGLQAQLFSALNRSEIDAATYLTYSDKYQGKLLELVDSESLLLAGGHDLNKELKRLDEIFTAGTKTSSVFFQGILEAQKQKYLGKDISLTEDIYPLLKGEYLLGMAKDFSRPEISILVQLADKNDDLLRIEKIVNAFIKVSAIFEPKIQEVTLPDGTRGQEVVASPEQVTRKDESYESVNITSLKIGNSETSIHYAAVGNTLLIHTNADGIRRLIDRANGKTKDGFKQSGEFRQSVAPIFGNADQVVHLNAQALFEQLGLKQSPENLNLLQPYLQPFQSISSTKNFFQDGISELYVIGIKDKIQEP